MFSRLSAKTDAPSLVGVVHMLPLPGAPNTSPGLDKVIDRACADATALAEGGAEGVIIENLGDAPFTAGRVDAFTTAAMTRVVNAVRVAAPGLVVGVNVLRNDALSALSIAAATEADFIRVNVLTGAMVTDQGLIQGCARELLLERKRLGVQTKIAADVLVKHAVPLGPADLPDVARDTWHRGGADALIITGRGTGRPTDPSDLITARQSVPDAPIWLGSGLTPESAPSVREHIDVAIVGTWLHQDARLDLPVTSARVAEMKASLTR